MIAIPIIGQLVDLICSTIGLFQVKVQKKIVKIQAEIEQITPEDGESTAAPIGFMIPTEEELINDDEE